MLTEALVEALSRRLSEILSERDAEASSDWEREDETTSDSDAETDADSILLVDTDWDSTVEVLSTMLWEALRDALVVSASDSITWLPLKKLTAIVSVLPA